MKKTPLRSRSAPLRSREPARGGRKPIKRKKRTPSEFARIYGSKARVEFVKSLPCAACGISGHSENAHVRGNDGTGRKAGYLTIVPLCKTVVWRDASFGCHELFDRKRWLFERSFPHFDAQTAALECEAAWQSHLRQTGRAPNGDSE